MPLVYFGEGSQRSYRNRGKVIQLLSRFSVPYNPNFPFRCILRGCARCRLHARGACATAVSCGWTINRPLRANSNNRRRLPSTRSFLVLVTVCQVLASVLVYCYYFHGTQWDIHIRYQINTGSGNPRLRPCFVNLNTASFLTQLEYGKQKDHRHWRNTGKVVKKMLLLVPGRRR